MDPLKEYLKLTVVWEEFLVALADTISLDNRTNNNKYLTQVQMTATHQSKFMLPQVARVISQLVGDTKINYLKKTFMLTERSNILKIQPITFSGSRI